VKGQALTTKSENKYKPSSMDLATGDFWDAIVERMRNRMQVQAPHPIKQILGVESGAQQLRHFISWNHLARGVNKNNKKGVTLPSVGNFPSLLAITSDLP